jgi:hypothetical protein
MCQIANLIRCDTIFFVPLWVCSFSALTRRRRQRRASIRLRLGFFCAKRAAEGGLELELELELVLELGLEFMLGLWNMNERHQAHGRVLRH